MAETYRDRFRRAMAVPQEDLSVKLARYLGAYPETPPSAPAASAPASPSPFDLPFTGLRNDRTPLPAFEPPGQSLPIQNYMPPPTPPVTVQATPPGPNVAPQGAAAPTPAADPQTIALAQALQQAAPQAPPAAAYDPNKDPRYLPDQWKGAFNNWQFPR